MPSPSADELRRDTLRRWVSAYVRASGELWRRSWDIGIRFVPGALDTTGGRGTDRRGARDSPVTAQLRHSLAEAALVPWLAAERFGQELRRASGRPKPVEPIVVDDRTVTLPFHVRDASQGFALYLVSRARVQRDLDAHDVPFAALDFGRGRTALVLSGVHHRDTDLGAYDEVLLGYLVTPRETPSALGLYVRDFPASERIAATAGRRIWGYPKTYDTVEFVEDAARATWTFRRRATGSTVLSVTFPRGGRGTTTAIPWRTYTLRRPRAGAPPAPHVTILTRTGRAERIQPGTDAVAVTLGDPAMNARDGAWRLLRVLGIARKRPVVQVWTEHMSATFATPEPID
jgi:hypothetical protein